MLLAGVLAVRLTGGESAAAKTVAPDDEAAMKAEGLRIRHEIQNDPVAPTIAPKGYDVTIVMFSDYQCPFCRKVHPVVENLMASDKKVKLVYRDWPIFGAPSTEAARAA
ncbi:MAG: DsbA family protein, partial [Myxococcota bacterium]